jgi:hypothetical protein
MDKYDGRQLYDSSAEMNQCSRVVSQAILYHEVSEPYWNRHSSTTFPPLQTKSYPRAAPIADLPLACRPKDADEQGHHACRGKGTQVVAAKQGRYCSFDSRNNGYCT